MNARMPSAASWLRISGSSCRKTWWTWSLKVSDRPMRIIRLEAWTASGALAAISAAMARARGISSSAATTSLVRPSARLSAADSVRPVKISSAAFDQPTSRGSSQVPPLSGTTPRFTKAAANFELSPRMRMSQPSAVSMP